MSEKEKQIMESFAEIVPKLSESDKSYLLGLGEGMAIARENQQTEEKNVVKTKEVIPV